MTEYALAKASLGRLNPDVVIDHVARELAGVKLMDIKADWKAALKKHEALSAAGGVSDDEDLAYAFESAMWGYAITQNPAYLPKIRPSWAMRR
jgi:hypothetical protein